MAGHREQVVYILIPAIFWQAATTGQTSSDMDIELLVDGSFLGERPIVTRGGQGVGEALGFGRKKLPGTACLRGISPWGERQILLGEVSPGQGG
jgi:hypothetical protein